VESRMHLSINMKKNIIILILSFYSVSLSLLISIWVVKNGGPRYLLEKLGLARHEHLPADWQIDWIARNLALPNTQDEIVFAGDSITAMMPWAEYYSDIRNRGIGDDTSDGLHDRIEEITESHPKQVFINIGINDLSKGVAAEEVAENIRQIVGKIRSNSPATEINIVSVLPINLDFDRSVRTEKMLRETQRLNQMLRESQEGSGFRFIDIAARFKDEKGYLRRELTHDGMHLNVAGQKLYCESLMPHVASRELAVQRRAPIAGANP
jgi:lysophospholipase L1-like esterase